MKAIGEIYMNDILLGTVTKFNLKEKTMKKSKLKQRINELNNDHDTLLKINDSSMRTIHELREIIEKNTDIHLELIADYNKAVSFISMITYKLQVNSTLSK